MSIKAYAWAKSVKAGSPTLKAVLCAIADYADDQGRAWPSLDRLASDTEFSARAVRMAVAELASLGLLTRTERFRPDGGRSTDILTLQTHLSAPLERGATPLASPSTPPAARSEPPAPNAKAPSKTCAPRTTTELPLNGSEANASGSTALAVLPAAFPMDDLSPIDQLWFEGKVILAEMGQQPRTSGSLIGGWIKRYHDPVRILGAMRFARSSGTQDPIPLIVATLEGPDGRQRASPAGKRGFFAAELARDLSKEWVQ